MPTMIQVKSAKKDQINLQMSEKCTNGKSSELPNISTHYHMSFKSKNSSEVITL